MLTALCFGANTTFAKIVVGEVSPMLVVCLRWFVVVLLLLLFNRRALYKDWHAIKPHLGYLLVMGALGLASFNGMFYLAAHYTSAINLGIISGMIPVFVLLGGMLAYRTSPHLRQWLGVAITLLGVVVVAAAGSLVRLLTLQLNYGDILVVVATLLYAGYTLGLRRRPDCSGLSLFTVLAALRFWPHCLWWRLKPGWASFRHQRRWVGLSSCSWHCFLRYLRKSCSFEVSRSSDRIVPVFSSI